MSDWEKHVGPGWQPIVKEAVDAIIGMGARIRQVKEKFGGLRIYYDSENRHDEIDDIIKKAELQCEKTCEECGGPGVISNNRGWLKTLCLKHRSPEQ